MQDVIERHTGMELGSTSLSSLVDGKDAWALAVSVANTSNFQVSTIQYFTVATIATVNHIYLCRKATHLGLITMSWKLTRLFWMLMETCTRSSHHHVDLIVGVQVLNMRFMIFLFYGILYNNNFREVRQWSLCWGAWVGLFQPRPGAAGWCRKLVEGGRWGGRGFHWL